MNDMIKARPRGRPKKVQPTAKIFSIEAQPGMQEQFLSSPADIVLGGGIAGSGKTWSLLMEPLRHISNSRFSAVIFRRTYPEITNEGGIWDTSCELYPIAGAYPRASDHEWRFPSGATVRFAHLQHEKDRYQWDSSQVPLICVAKGTKIKMADGTLKNIENIKQGDTIITLEGTRNVLKTFPSRMASCVLASVYDSKGNLIGIQIHPDDHPILTPWGWISYLDLYGFLRASEYAVSCKSFLLSELKPESLLQERNIEMSNIERHPLCGLLSFGHSDHDHIFSYLIDDRNNYAEFGDLLPTGKQPLLLSVPVILHAPRPRQNYTSSCRHDIFYGLSGLLIQDYQDNCSVYFHPYDERFQCRIDSDLNVFPLSGDVAVSFHPYYMPGDSGNIQLHNRRNQFEYDHPYTMERRLASEGVHVGSCIFSPFGIETVYDICVEEVNHYITMPGLINKNCFDQLEHQSARTFWYMFSRNRSLCGVRPYFRLTANPTHPKHWLRNFIDWWIDPLTGLPIESRSNQIRWFVRIGDEIDWADSREQLLSKHGPEVLPKSFTFIRGRLSENKILLKKDPGYRANLHALSWIDRERLLYGNWNVGESSGDFFQRDWFEVVGAAPVILIDQVRYWDRAASEEGSKGSWTAGVRMGRAANGLIYIIDVVRLRGSGLTVKRTILNTATQDGHAVRIGIEQDPGQAGKVEAQDQVRNLAGFNVQVNVVREAKGMRAKPFSAQAEAGNIKLVRGAWNEAYLNELQNFDGTEKFASDQVDASSGAFLLLTSLKNIGIWGKRN